MEPKVQSSNGSANRDQTIVSGENRWDYTEQTNRWPNGAQNSDGQSGGKRAGDDLIRQPNMSERP